MKNFIIRPVTLFFAAGFLSVIGSANQVQALETCKPSNASEANKCFALLVGVNDYAPSKDNNRETPLPLKGPGNDVALMKNLLVSQFGFRDDASHIVSLVGAQATHKAIIDGLSQHLVENAKRFPGSKVLFYFSGHGSQLSDETGDKGSGYHQALLAYDSRSEGGSDIIDDEINAQLEVLRRYSDQITLIFDSCHSGSVWKDVTTMTSKAAPPRSSGNNQKVAYRAKPLDLEGTIRPAGGEYSVIVAATADQLAVEDQLPTAGGPKYHGLLTFYLDKVVRSSLKLTYDQIAKRVASDIEARAPSQHPQAEGDINRIFLGAFAEREQPYIHVLSVLNPKKFEIGAGLADGLREGAIVALYSKDSKDLLGDKGKFGIAHLVEVSNFTSVAELAGTPKAPVTTDAKIQIITPFAPPDGMTVFVPVVAGDSSTQGEAKAFLDRLSQQLSQSRLVSITDDPHRAKILVRWDCVDEHEAKPEAFELTLLQPTNINCLSGYKFYLSPPDHLYRLFDLEVQASGDVELLAKATEARARQENLRILENRASRIIGDPPGRSPISVEMETVDIGLVNGNPVITKKRSIKQGVPQIPVGQHFQLKITNNSQQTLYMVVVWIGSGGGTHLYTPAHNGDKVLAGNTLTTWPPLTAGPPRGLETYKVIATTKPDVDFHVLDQPNITRDVIGSPLEWLLNQTGNTNVRDRSVGSDLDLGDWITAQRDVFIVP